MQANAESTLKCDLHFQGAPTTADQSIVRFRVRASVVA